MSSSVETELKLVVPVTREPDLLSHPVFKAAGVPLERRIVSTYFDSADQALHKLGASLRVRQTGRKFVQTLKMGAFANLSGRGEWEWQIGRNSPEISLLAETPAAELLASLLKRPLEPLFVTDVIRSIQTLHLEGGAIVEAAFDRGFISAGKAKDSIRELELELRGGPRTALYHLALELHKKFAIGLRAESKASRGYALKNGASPASVDPTFPHFSADIVAKDAICDIVRSELDALLGNMPAARAGDAEGIHKMRVGVRRLRSALLLFDPYLAANPVAAFQTQLREMGQAFGEARDWDVLCLESLPIAARHEDIDVVDPVRAPAARRREEAHAHFVYALDRPTFTSFALKLAAWAADGRANTRYLGDRKLEKPLSRLAPRLLDHLYRKVRKRGRHLKNTSGDDLHSLRKSLKKLRYSIEYVKGLYEIDEVEAFLKPCKKLQKKLGAINDVVTAGRLVSELAHQSASDLSLSRKAFDHRSRRGQSKGARGAFKKWIVFREVAPFWK